jgi:phosphopentomutase
MNHFIDYADKDFNGLAYINLVDFDALFGHRRDPLGYKQSLEEFDVQLGELIKKLKEDDLLMITADHGNDPTAPGSDHTREYVPMLAYSKSLKGSELEIRESFADIGATITDNFKSKHATHGKSFLKDLK